MTTDGKGDTLPVGAGILSRPDGATIAYHRLAGKTPGVVFLHGYRSDMEGGKALALEARCRAQGRAFLRFDYFGHGKSSGDHAAATIGRWATDAVAVVSALTRGPQVLVGSSLGGWVSLLTALDLGPRIAGIVGVAAAPDFTEDLIWNELGADQRRDLLEKGQTHIPNPMDPDDPWPIPRALIEDGRNHLLLRDSINLGCPVRLLQGQADPDVPWQTALTIAHCLTGDDVRVVLVKDGDHRLSRPADIDLLCREVNALIDGLAGE